MTPRAGVPRKGEVVGGKYRVREYIGEGGMGVVFLADHLSQGRMVALKVLQPALATSDALVRRFQTEAMAAGRVAHAGAVSVIDSGMAGEGKPYIAMELVPGRSLSALLAEEELPVPRAFEIVRQLLCTLEEAHAHGVVHADIKSDNIIVERTPGGDVLTLIDFGLARIEGQQYGDDDDGALISGTPEYMAPELVRGAPPTAQTDLYGVGVILYKLLTGRTPFEGGSASLILLRQLEDDAVAPSLRRPDRGIPAELDRIVLRALHKDPAQRFASASELGRALEAVAWAGDQVGAVSPMQRAS
jgi:serine/threonine-protein kinase